ncbi:MAG: flavodoxin domain-containing protein [Candidatus Promineifilaceae bacterium]
MTNKVLVTYATKYGATAEIAEAIAAALRDEGLEVDLKPVKQAGDLAPYHAVVLGSAVYIGGWRKEAAKFLLDNEQALAQKDVWLFSSGPTNEGDPLELLNGWTLPEKLQPVAERIQVHDTAVFHGALDEDKLNFVEKFMVSKVGSGVGDFRDWEVIRTWAASIAGALKQSAD